jgi:hypothetical protein
MPNKNSKTISNFIHEEIRQLFNLNRQVSNDNIVFDKGIFYRISRDGNNISDTKMAPTELDQRVLYFAMCYLLCSVGSGAIGERYLLPILDKQEAVEFILDNWYIEIPNAGFCSARSVIDYVLRSPHGTICYQTALVDGSSDVQRIFREEALARGDVVIVSNRKHVKYVNGKEQYFDEEDVLMVLSRMYDFDIADITKPNGADLARITLATNVVPQTLLTCATKIELSHHCVIRFVKLEGRAEFVHDGIHYINLKNKNLSSCIERLQDAGEDFVMAFLFGLLQMNPF